MAATQTDLVKGELIALPILLLALLFVFRGWRSALMPVISALVTVAGALLILLAVTKAIDVGGYAIDVVALFGIALAVDYSLLMVSRFREERAAALEADLAPAVTRTVQTAGRTITFSALTVIASLAGLFAFDDPTFTSLAVGGIATVLVALAAGLTLVPALLGVWGRKIRPAAPDSRRRVLRPARPAGTTPSGRCRGRRSRHPAGRWRAVPRRGLRQRRPPHPAGLLRKPRRQRPARHTLPRHSGQPDQGRGLGRDQRPTGLRLRPAGQTAARRRQRRSSSRACSGAVSAIDVTPTGTSQDSTAQRLVHDLRGNRAALPDLCHRTSRVPDRLRSSKSRTDCRTRCC